MYGREECKEKDSFDVILIFQSINVTVTRSYDPHQKL
jgi:hypothetical protein